MAGRGDNSGRDSSRPESKPKAADEVQMNLVVDDVPYLVKVTPFSFNDEKRYYITINGGPEHVFTWDTATRTVRAIDDDASVLPDALEEEISRRLLKQ
jgi:hypothetical protein